MIIECPECHRHREIKVKPGTKQALKAMQRVCSLCRSSNKQLTAEAKAKISKSLIGNQNAKGTIFSAEARQKVSEAGRRRRGIKYKGHRFEKRYAYGRNVKWYTLQYADGTEFKVQGSYELRYAQHLLECGIEFVAHPKSIPYVLDDVQHRYHPDFWLPSLNAYVEIKSNYTLNLPGVMDKITAVQNQGINVLVFADFILKRMQIIT